MQRGLREGGYNSQSRLQKRKVLNKTQHFCPPNLISSDSFMYMLQVREAKYNILRKNTIFLTKGEKIKWAEKN